MLVTVMLTSLILGITGVAVVEFGFYGQSEANATAATVQQKYTVESHVSKALWRVNTFEDTLVSYSDGPVTVNYDTTTMRLTVVVSSDEETRAVTADLMEDMHFNHSIATNDSLVLGRYTLGNEPEHPARGEFRFLPQVDLQYFIDSAVTIHTQSDYWFTQADFASEGIHVFTGSNLVFESVTLYNSTLVFTGVDIWFYKQNDIRTRQNPDEQLPALIFTNEDSYFDIDKEWFWYPDIIAGAIYSAGKVEICHGTVTGPVVAHKAAIRNDLDFRDDYYEGYYVWNTGFGAYEDYDWPKHIQNWNEVWLD